MGATWSFFYYAASSLFGLVVSTALRTPPSVHSRRFPIGPQYVVLRLSCRPTVAVLAAGFVGVF